MSSISKADLERQRQENQRSFEKRAILKMKDPVIKKDSVTIFPYTVTADGELRDVRTPFNDKDDPNDKSTVIEVSLIVSEDSDFEPNPYSIWPTVDLKAKLKAFGQITGRTFKMTSMGTMPGKKLKIYKVEEINLLLWDETLAEQAEQATA